MLARAQWWRALRPREARPPLRAGCAVAFSARTAASPAARRIDTAHGASARPWEPHALQDLCDLRYPHRWYPRARRLRRCVQLHVGPTNSGKTHHALQALKAAASGIYCGPLRLLAWEVYERLNAEGTPCSLLTGQEVEEVAGARVVSSTVEMASIDDARVKCVVLDEIQMLADPDRGWAWSRVLLGSAAPTIHACGDPSAVPLVTALLRLTGDELVVHRYSRLSPLQVAARPLASLSGVQRGDCLVAFSRRELFKIKREVEGATGLRCGVVYGALPPQVRREQALRFNMRQEAAPSRVGGLEQRGGSALLEPTDVLIATDAIGMGLNLQIGRIIFSRLDKFDGHARRQLSVSEIKQIAGRAGRFGSACPIGVVSALQRPHLPRLSSALAAATPQLRSAGVLPQLAQLEEFAAALLQLPGDGAGDDEHAGLRRALSGGAAPPPVGEQRADRRSATAARELQAQQPGALNASAGWAGLFDPGGNFVEMRSFASPSPPPAPRDRDDDVEGLCSALSGFTAYGVSLAHRDPAVGAAGGSSGAGAGLGRLLGATARCEEHDDDDDGDDDGDSDDDGDDDSDSDDDGDCYDDDDDDDDDGLNTLLADGRLRPPRTRRSTRRRADAVLTSGSLTFTQVLEGFLGLVRINSGLYHLCDCSSMLAISRKLDAVPGLPFRVRYAWCLAPVDVDNPLLAAALKRFARKFAETGRVRVGLRVPAAPPRSPAELAELESAHAVYDLYLWLARRYPAEFVELPQAVEAAAATQALIQQGLQAMGDAVLARAAKRRRAPAEAAQPTRGDGDDSDVDPEAAGSEYLRSMLVADEEELDDEEDGVGEARQRGSRAAPRQRRAAAEERRAAKKEARRAGRWAMSMLEHAFEAGGLAEVRRMQRGAAWKDALVELLPDRGGGGGARERRGERSAWGRARGGNEALLAGLAPPPRGPRAARESHARARAV